MNLGSENETVEFKKSTGEYKEALQAISAMLNKHGRGELYFGMKDDGNVIAQDVSDATLRHRDYATGTTVEVNMFMDTVQIVSPGLFPEGDSSERHLEGVASEFGLRNPAIARTLFRAGVIEQYGTGIPRIKEACEAAGVKFRFEQTVNSTVVVFKRPGLQVNDRTGSTASGAVGAVADSAVLENLNETERIAARRRRGSWGRRASEEPRRRRR